MRRRIWSSGVSDASIADMGAAIGMPMIRRQPIPAMPRIWMMTDERQGEGLWRGLLRMPRGAGVIVRHKSLTPAERRLLYTKVRALGRRRGLVVLLADTNRVARRWGADGSHNRCAGPPRVGTASAHNLKEIRAAERSGAGAFLLSPVFATRSHPGAPALGPLRFAALARATNLPVIALGGMTTRRARRVMALGAYGWAGIDAFG
jgi:thiamine-phosphate pyrophosphorylase